MKLINVSFLVILDSSNSWSSGCCEWMWWSLLRGCSIADWRWLCSRNLLSRWLLPEIIITQNVKPNNEDRIFINSRICGELWSSTDSTSYELSDTSFIRVVSKRQVWIISHCKRSCSGVSINEVLEKLCVLCNDVHLSDMQIWWACWFQVFWLVWKESLECLCGVLWFFSSRFVGLFVMTQI